MNGATSNLPNHPAAGVEPVSRPKFINFALSLCVALMALAIGSGAWADKIVLKNGRSIEGAVDQMRSNADRVYVRTSSGTIMIARRNVETIELRDDLTPEESQGDELLERGDLNRALASYLRAYEKQPDNETLDQKIKDLNSKIQEIEAEKFEGEFKAIDQELAARHYAEAIVLARDLVKRVGEDSGAKRCRMKLGEAYRLQAKDFRDRVNYPRAEAAYRSAVAADPDGAQARLELGAMVATYPTRLEEALILYDEGIELARKDPTLMTERQLLDYRQECAQHRYSNGERRRAARDFWALAQDEPDRFRADSAVDRVIKAYNELRAQLTEPSEENAEALGILGEIIATRPLDYKARVLLGTIYHDREDWERSARYLEQSLPNMRSLSSLQSAEAKYLLGIAHGRMGSFPKAVEYLTEVLEYQPSRYEAICELGEAYLGMFQYRRALTQFSNARRIDGANFRAHLDLGRAYLALDRHAEALASYERLFELRDEHPAYLHEMGVLHAAMNQVDDAVSSYRRALELAEEQMEAHPEFRDLQAEIYTDLGLAVIQRQKEYESIGHFDKAIEIRPTYARAYGGKGLAYANLKQLDLAEKFLLKAIEFEPNDPGLQLSLGRFFQIESKAPDRALEYYLAYFEKGGEDPAVRDWIRECGGTPPA